MHVLNILWGGIRHWSDAGTEFEVQNQFNGGFVGGGAVRRDAGGHGSDVAAAHHESGLRQHAGELAIIVVFGAVIGKLMVDGAQRYQIAHTLLARLGLRYVQLLSVIIIGLIFGLAMFYEVAFIMLAPLVIVIAASVFVPETGDPGRSSNLPLPHIHCSHRSRVRWRW